MKQQKVDKPVLHVEDEFQVTKLAKTALTTKPREEINNPSTFCIRKR